MAGIIRNLLRSSSNKMSISNSNEISIDNMEKKLRSWKLPKVNTSELYSKPFGLRHTYVIKTVESSHFVTDSNMSFQLFSKNALQEHKNKGFKFVHIGLVQVGVQPLTKHGLNGSVIACIRDKRHYKFEDALLGLAETSLRSGPIYLNCFPNFSVSLSDIHIMKVLTLDLQTNGCRYEGDVGVVYRVYYKAMDTVAPCCRYTVKHGVTTIFQTNLEDSRVTVPKSIKWEDVTPPESWILEDQIQSPENGDEGIITKDVDGGVVIRFGRNRASSFTPHRHSTSRLASSSSNANHPNIVMMRGVDSRGESSSSRINENVESPEKSGTLTAPSQSNVSFQDFDDISVDTNQCSTKNSGVTIQEIPDRRTRQEENSREFLKEQILLENPSSNFSLNIPSDEERAKV